MRRNCRLFHRISFVSRPHLALSANAAACILAGRRRNRARTPSGSISSARQSRCGKLGMWRKGRRFPSREPGIYRPRRSRHTRNGHATIMRATATRAMATRATVTRRLPDALAVHTPSAAPASAKCMTSDSGHHCVPSASEHAGAVGYQRRTRAPITSPHAGAVGYQRRTRAPITSPHAGAVGRQRHSRVPSAASPAFRGPHPCREYCRCAPMLPRVPSVAPRVPSTAPLPEHRPDPDGTPRSE